MLGDALKKSASKVGIFDDEDGDERCAAVSVSMVAMSYPATRRQGERRRRRSVGWGLKRTTGHG